MTITEWIAARRALEGDLTEGPWVAEYGDEQGDCVLPHDAESTREAVAITRLYHCAGDAAFIADARTALPQALAALEAVVAGHRPVSFTFGWNTGITMHEVCATCHDKAGTHECGCWRDEDEDHCCAMCSLPAVRGGRVAYPCPTVRAIAEALEVEP